MNKTADRPPIVIFLLAFAGLVAAALCLAALSPEPEPTNGGASPFNERGSAADRPTTTSPESRAP